MYPTMNPAASRRGSEGFVAGIHAWGVYPRMKIAGTTLLMCVIAASGCMAELGEGTGEEDIVQQTEALAGYRLVTAETAVDTTSVKDVTASCPPGTVAFGAGHAALSSSNTVYRAELRHFAPNATGTTWRTRAEGVIKGGGAWKLRVVVTCGTKPEGYKILAVDSTASTTSTQSVAPVCGTGKAPTLRTLGGGFTALDAAGKIVDGDLVNFRANIGSWAMTAKSLTAGATWKLRGYALCASSTALAGHQVIITRAPYTETTSPAPTITGKCSTGQVAIAAGARLVSVENTDLELRAVYSVPVAGGWTSTGVRIPPTRKGVPAPMEFQQSMICLN
jgi:hypothetical protein